MEICNHSLRHKLPMSRLHHHKSIVEATVVAPLSPVTVLIWRDPTASENIHMLTQECLVGLRDRFGMRMESVKPISDLCLNCFLN